MSNFGIFNGKEFLDLKLEKREWIIENILRQGDSMIIVGNEKSGKSLLTQQLIFSLTSSQPFLDKWEVSKEYKVSYIQLEGELSDTQDRFLRMKKTLEFEPDNFQLLFYPPLELQLRHEILKLKENIEEFKPSIVIIDPLYFAFSGSLSDDNVVRQFIGNIRVFKDALNCAVIIIHHTHKLRLKQDGTPMFEGDEAMFGSKFLKAYPDHTMLFSHNKVTDIRVLSCDTQRSGDIVKQCNLKLVQPDPLYFEEEYSKPDKKEVILELLNRPEYEEGLSIANIVRLSNLSRTNIYLALKPVLSSKQCEKLDDRRPVIYRTKK